jgi:hypothetical protein
MMMMMRRRRRRRRRRWTVMMIWNILRMLIDNMILEFSRD